jgi:S1-C subfamily serine protease
VLVTVENLAAMLRPPKAVAPGPWLAVHVVDSSAGPSIDGIDPNGPAGAAGLVVGDTITAVDGKPVTTVDELKSAVAAHQPGDTITITVFRQDQSTVDRSITLATAPSM